MGKESREVLWPDEETWLGFFHEALCEDPELAEQVRVSVLFEHLAKLMGTWGPEGVRIVRLILRQALRLIYPFTSSIPAGL